MNQERPVYTVSDGSGLTAETVAHTLLTQFPGVEFRHVSLPFVNTHDKLEQAVNDICRAGQESGVQPLVFTTFVQDDFSERLQHISAEVFNLFEPFINRIERALDQHSSHKSGQAHGIANVGKYNRRINAINYALHCDDGLHTRDYDQATVILLGVSRSGKTPTSLYLAMHFGFYAANYPLTEDDFDRRMLPSDVVANKERVFGLTIDPVRLQQIRSERRPNSRYASLSQCQEDVRLARELFDRNNIPFCDSTGYSVEELGSQIKHQMALQSELI
ncbi:MAG: pyruvate, water dikinase regulatory protein [Pseudomonadota bacterium]